MAELYLIEFKGARREYFLNTYYHNLNRSDFVVIQTDRGEDVGILSKRIELEIDFSDRDRPRSILRKASDEDVERHRQLRKKESEYKREILSIIQGHRLRMKVVDVECQFDGNKMTVYFTADHRVDFRSLVKELASCYKTRIELRQIGVRDEAKRIGGYGICGREQCCSSFLTEFTPISTGHARVQDLALNPSKISGNCGRLLCCLKYETDTYSKIKKTFPALGTKVKCSLGVGLLTRIDIFKEEAIIHTADGVVIKALADELEVVSSSDQDRSRGPKALSVSDSRDPSEETTRFDKSDKD